MSFFKCYCSKKEDTSNLLKELHSYYVKTESISGSFTSFYFFSLLSFNLYGLDALDYSLLWMLLIVPSIVVFSFFISSLISLILIYFIDNKHKEVSLSELFFLHYFNPKKMQKFQCDFENLYDNKNYCYILFRSFDDLIPKFNVNLYKDELDIKVITNYLRYSDTYLDVDLIYILSIENKESVRYRRVILENINLIFNNFKSFDYNKDEFLNLFLNHFEEHRSDEKVLDAIKLSPIFSKCAKEIELDKKNENVSNKVFNTLI